MTEIISNQSPSMVGENFRYILLKWLKMHLTGPLTIWTIWNAFNHPRGLEKIEIYLSEEAENVSDHPPWLEKIEIYLSEKAENVSDHPPWVDKNIEIYRSEIVKRRKFWVFLKETISNEWFQIRSWGWQIQYIQK